MTGPSATVLHRMAEFLDEVRVTACDAYSFVECPGREADTFLVRRASKGGAGVVGPQVPDGRELEQALCVGHGITRQLGDLWQAGADECDRQLPLNDLVEASTMASSCCVLRN